MQIYEKKGNETLFAPDKSQMEKALAFISKIKMSNRIIRTTIDWHILVLFIRKNERITQFSKPVHGGLKVFCSRVARLLRAAIKRRTTDGQAKDERRSSEGRATVKRRTSVRPRKQSSLQHLYNKDCAKTTNRMKLYSNLPKWEAKNNFITFHFITFRYFHKCEQAKRMRPGFGAHPS